MRSMLLGLALLLPTAALSEPIESQKIITALTGDWNGDGAIDLAVIVETEPGHPMDLHFFLRDREANFLKPAGIVREHIYGEWNDYDRPSYGASDTEPELTALPNGSIKLYLPAMPIGSERTDTTLTIAYRNGAFIVAGFAYDYYDYLEDNVASDCDYNVLTGKGKSSKKQPDGTTTHKTVSVEGQVVPFAEWSPGTGFSACGE
ncbi:MAG: hypothetical protein E5W82_31715 [Mesorhizobium sp.]|uniref:hypothetical protein n=1 Tax=Mesorhizobium sp. TaxID=1871066 RepID=UPI0011F72420|nr:hypothetical protein [Mesorhizobium sp.]TIS53760.1 MAG: hypothetical protein E5W91_29705 [Mesorhizobium sp.]TIS86119.1 MAG: hypothetical protein E5W89_30415 [Mesorhizobium sp.]TJW03873.1 MAG: hypothetical protein E5W82_31715 [Mesorhizobium sp.]TJW41340.1 MAG: hypothetical protein E5W83_26140 [Mesorhizobium sp.]